MRLYDYDRDCFSIISHNVSLFEECSFKHHYSQTIFFSRVRITTFDSMLIILFFFSYVVNVSCSSYESLFRFAFLYS